MIKDMIENTVHDDLDEGLQKAKKWRNIYVGPEARKRTPTTIYGPYTYNSETEADSARLAVIEELLSHSARGMISESASRIPTLGPMAMHGIWVEELQMHFPMPVSE